MTKSLANTSRDTGLRELHGRQMNVLNENYMLPGDDLEMKRLNLQHRSITIGLGGLYPKSYAETIRRRLQYREGEGETTGIADLGCGSGDWIIEMAKEFPHIKALGIDLVSRSLSNVPPNVSFEVRDVTKDMTRYYGKFDMIQARCIANGIADYDTFLSMVWQCLKPGGILMILDGYGQLFDTNLHGRQSERGIDRLFSEISHRMKHPNGVRVGGIGYHTEPFVRKHGGFENIRFDSLYIPVGWSGSTEYCEEPTAAGRWMQENTKNMCGAWKPVLMSTGVSEAEADDWIKEAEMELDSPEKLRAYSKWTTVCAQKP